MSNLDDDIEHLANRLAAGDRRVLARAITRAEATRDDHRRATEALLARIMARTREAPSVSAFPARRASANRPSSKPSAAI